MLSIILYTLLYIKKEQKQTGKEGQKRKRNGRERGTGQGMPPSSSPVPRLSSVPSAVRTVRTIASAHHFTKSHQHTKNGRTGTLPRLCVMLSPPPRHRSTIKKNRGAGRMAVCHPAASRLRPSSCCFFPPSSFSSLRLDLFRSLLPDVLPASSHFPGGEG